MPYKPLGAKPNFPELEEEVGRYWQDNKIFEKSVQNRANEEPFVFFEGPPTANAGPALHHVLARAFKDVVCRFQTLRGKYVLRKAGWDTHGLPVELQIEKKLGISGKPQIENIVPGDKFASIAKFNELCRESVWQFKSDWEKLTARMGYWVDMSDPYITYEPKYIETVWWLLAELYKKDLVYEGHKVVPYCPRCGTALSSHEVAQGYEEVTDTSVYVKFKLKPGQKVGNHEVGDNTYILSWTTTPWTLPGNVALAVGEKIKYVMMRVDKVIDNLGNTWVQDKRSMVRNDGTAPITQGSSTGGELRMEFIIFAADRLELIKKICESEGYVLYKDSKEELVAKDVIGMYYQPLFDIPELKSEKSHKIYAADFVTTEEGTGVVHTAVMYGEDDYQLGEREGLPRFHTVDETGKFIRSVPNVAGLGVKEEETEEKIISYLKDHNLLFKAEKYKHTYPFCWRCGTALLYYARNSWYVKMSELRKPLLKNNEKIYWQPEHIKDGRFGEWLREVKDWAISRERYWGTPLPFWRCKECQEVKAVSSFSELGLGEVTENKVHRPYVDEIKLKCEKCGGQAERTPEVLDVWFDSGAMPYAQWHWPFDHKDLINKKKQFPAHYISEGIDQTRGWFYTLLAISTALGFGPAYKQAVSAGHILDEKGQKMSKSKGNIVDPWDIFNNFGADAIRWYFFTVNQPGETKLFKKEDVSVVQRKVFTILANVYNYFVTYANANNWQFDNAKSPEITKNSKNILDQWINARLQDLANNVAEQMEKLHVFRAVREIEKFIDDLSTWYLRRSRNRTDEEFFATLYGNLVWLVKIMSPFAPFFTEYLYRSLSDANYPESVHLTDWRETKKLSKSEQKLVEHMAEVRHAAELGNALRKQKGLKVRQPLPAVWVGKASKDVEWSGELKRVLLDELNVKDFKKTETSESLSANGLEVFLDVTLTDELRFEGDVRELERAVQALRKEAGLSVGQPAKLYYEVSGEMEDLFKSLNKDRLSIQSMEKNKNTNVSAQSHLELSGGTAWLGVEKIG